MAELDWSEIKADAEEAVKPLPEGTYTFEVAKATWAPSKSSGQPMLALQNRVASGPQEGKTVFHYMVLNMEKPRSKAAFVADLAAIKGAAFRPAINGTAEEMEGPMIGARFKATVAHDGMYNGQPNLRLRNLQSAGGAEETPPPPAEASEPAPVDDTGDDDAPPPRPA